jgi:hypothetical protein
MEKFKQIVRLHGNTACQTAINSTIANPTTTNPTTTNPANCQPPNPNADFCGVAPRGSTLIC